jgi:hypothetical protein
MYGLWVYPQIGGLDNFSRWEKVGDGGLPAGFQTRFEQIQDAVEGKEQATAGEMRGFFAALRMTNIFDEQHLRNKNACKR